MPSSYQYQPLSSPTTQIRLLELLPGRGTIQCQLKVTDLEEAEGTYEPISYCWKAYTRKHWWGSSYNKEKKQRKFRLRIDEGNFYITENLHGALGQMRLDSRVRVLWADAICINQEDDEEKSAQVAMMAQIYQSGFQTLAWLGEADHRTRIAFEFFKTYADQASRTTSLSSQLAQSEPEMIPSTSRRPSAPAFFRWLPALRDWVNVQRQITSVKSVIGRPYFRRAWVVQEIAKSDRVLFMCGKFDITWDDLAHGFKEFQYWVPGQDSFSALDEIWSFLYDYDLIEVAMMVSSTQASDPRDKLYGILGLVPDSGMTTNVTVDYNKDPEQVFYDFTKGLLLSSTKLSVLSMSYGCSPDKPRHVPSWVWNPQPNEPFDRFSLPHSTSKHYQTAQKSRSQPVFRGSILGLRGIVLQTITTISPGWKPAYRRHLPFHLEDPRLLLGQLVMYIEHKAAGGISNVSTDSTTAEHRWNTWIRTNWPDMFSAETPLPEFDRIEEAEFIERVTCFDAEVLKHFEKYVSGHRKPMTLWNRLSLLVRIEKLMVCYVFGDPAVKRFGALMPPTSGLRHRRLARTDGGHMVLCAKETAVKDKLVLLQGSDVPFILRPTGERWQIVGECYVHTLMDGSAWDESQCEMLWIE